VCFALGKTPALGAEQGSAGATLGTSTTGRGTDSTTRQAGTPPTRPPAARTVSDGTPATRSEATGATERRFAAASHRRRSHTSHAPPERVLKGAHCTVQLCLPATAHSNLALPHNAVTAPRARGTVSGYVQRRGGGCTPGPKSGTLRARFAGECPRKKSDAPRRVPYSLRDKHTTRSVTVARYYLL